MTTPARIVVLDVSSVLAIQELELPDVEGHEVNVEILAAAIGQQQLHQVQLPPDEPMIMGAEATGHVVAVGESVTRVGVGDTVIVTAQPAGGRKPEPTALEMADGFGVHTDAPYSWATNVILDEQYLVPVPPTLDKESRCVFGATASLLTAELSGSVQDKTVAVFGAQGTGVTAVAVAAAANAGAVIAIDTSPDRLAVATAVGATEVIEGGIAEAVAALEGTVDVLIDAIFEFDIDGQRPGLDLLGAGGRAIVAGVAGNDDEAQKLIDAVDAGFSTPEPADTEKAIAQLVAWHESGTFNASASTPSRFTIEQANEAVQQLEDGVLVGLALMVIEPLK